MAIQNARILIRRGNEVDFDANNMQPGEWALSTDEKIVRICVAPGVCIRMATYDAFETDMAKIEAILEQAKSIKEAVTLINTEVSENAKAVAEYTEQAKQYRDEAEQFRNEAETFTPEGYSELVQNVEENTVKIETILEKGGLTFDESASGENIHLTDTTDNKVTAFALYGKGTQESTTGKNLLENTATSTTISGVAFTVNDDGSVTADGTATSNAMFVLVNDIPFNAGDYILTGCPSGGGTSTYRLIFREGDSDANLVNIVGDTGSGVNGKFTTDGNLLRISITVYEGATVSNLTFYPMIRLATETDATYEPYTGGIASPNPDYPQEIEVAGASGSVEVKSVGKNKLNNTATSQTVNGGTVTVNEDKSVTVNGTFTATTNIEIISDSVVLEKSGLLSGCPSGGSANTYNIQARNNTTSKLVNNYGGDTELTVGEYNRVILQIASGYTANNLVFRPMISFEGGEYEPYTETTSTIPTPNGLPGIPVSSGGNYTDENGQQWICDEVVKYADGSGKRVQRIGKAVFDGSSDEGWQINTTSDNSKKRLQTNSLKVLIKNTALNTTISTLLCDKFIATKPQENYNATNGIIQHKGLVLAYSDCFNTNDVTLWTAYLAENPMTLYYELAEPIITDLSAEEIAEIEKLQTFYPVTNISNDAGCGMEIAYKADVKNYIDNIILSRVATLETAVINNL